MSDISILARIVNGYNRNVDISSNTLVTTSIKVGGGVTNTELTKTILDGLISHAASTSNPHSVTKAQVGLTNVDDVQQLPMSYLDTDNTLAANSDAKVSSQKAIKAYVDSHSGAASSALDGTFTINNTATPSKKIAFSASGITASTTRTVTMPDANVDLGALTNSNIGASAAIVESKLSLDYSTSSLNTAIGSKLTANTAITGATKTKITYGANGLVTAGADATTADIADSTNKRYVTDAELVVIGNTSGTNTGDQSAGGVANTPAGNIAATTVQAAINELDSEKVAKSGDSMTGALAMGGNKITGLGAPTANGDALRFDQLGANSGIATLDAGGKVPVSQLPNSVMTFEGTWNATTNTPTLADATGNAGMVYLVSVGGTQDLGSGSQTFAPGDWVVANSTVVWEKSINSNAVVSVNGSTGVVTVNAINELTGDVTASAASGSQSKATTIASGAVTGTKIASDTITNSNINSAAAIAYSKLALSNSIVAGDITSDAVTTAKILNANVTLAKLASDSVDENKLKSTALGSTLTGGSGTVVNVASAPKLMTSEVAGESFAATTLIAVRFAQGAETAGRVRKADNDASVTDNFHVIGIAFPAGAISNGGTIDIVELGPITATSHGFTIGAPIFLGASGVLTNTAPSAASTASVQVGFAKDANTIFVKTQVLGVN
jgi:hypothetical protein